MLTMAAAMHYTDSALTSITVVEISDGDNCAAHSAWTLRVGMTVTNPNDGYYQFDIEYATDSAGTSWSVLASDVGANATYDDNTGTLGNISGVTFLSTTYRKYRVKMIRRSDSSLITTKTSSQLTKTLYSDSCP